MAYTDLSPTELLADGLAAPRITDQPWLVRWDRVRGDIGDLVLRALPPTMDLHTSGSTGPRSTWRRTREQLWAEAELLAGLVRPHRPQAVAAFAPPRHLFGALASVLMPARLGLPAYYRPGFFGALPSGGRRRWAVVATPWIFTLLLEHRSWMAATADITVLHSTAMLPATAADFLAAAGPERARVVEVFGATEAGGIASRSWSRGNPPWRLFDDVSFAMSTDDGEVPLTVRSPRLASEPGEPPPAYCRLDDLVIPLDRRSFRFVGRANRLVKVNGRRFNLDELERSLRSQVRCADLALVPVSDALVGEHVDLLVVPERGTAGDQDELRAAIVHIGFRPRMVRWVGRIDRSETGKLRRAPIAEAGARR